MSYRDLEIWQLARKMSIEIHRVTLNNLPKSEMQDHCPIKAYARRCINDLDSLAE